MLQIRRLFVVNSGALRVSASKLLSKTRFPMTPKLQIRSFSNEELRTTINNVNAKYESEQGKDKNEKEEIKDESKDNVNNNTGNQFTNENNSALDFLKSSYTLFVDNVKLAYSEMIGEDKESSLSRSVQQAQSFRPAKKHVDEDGESIEEKAEESTGPSALVVVKEAKSPWEQMRDRLQDSPLIRELLKNGKHFRKAAVETDLGKKAENLGKSVQDKISDAREFWETSQNPIVYAMSGAWDNLTGETEEGIATAEIRKLDPKFSKEEWAEEVRLNLAPRILKAHLQGDTVALKPWLGEAVYNKLAADIRARKHDGIVFDSNILEIDENQIVMKFMESGSPIIVIVYMVQQINCIRNRKGEIIEGSETDIRAKFYSMAFRQEYDEDSSVVGWKIVDYEFAGDVPYL